VIQALHKAATEINRYPDILGGSLRARLAEYTQTQPEQIIVGNGSDDLIELILKVFVGVGDEVLLPTPTFFIYEFATRVMGGIPVPVPRDAQFDIDIELLLSKSSKRSKVVFLANPNNPTANLIAREKIISLLQRANYMVVVDECYYEIAGETVLDLIDKYPNLIVLRSLSKSFGLAGIRLGYAVANPKTIEYLYRLAQLFPVNKLAIVAGEAALADLAYVQQNIQNICDSRETLKRALEALGSIVYPSSTNFLFVQTNDISSQELVAELAKREIYVADFGGKQGLDNHYWRTSVGSAKENAMLLDALREILA
jgi:histidinol-phosphate aminotransferase